MKKVVFVAGASSGLGRAVAEHLASRGFTVYAGARSFTQDPKTFPKGCFGINLDVTEQSSVAKAFQTVAERETTLFALVNCAAFFTMGAAEEIPPEEYARVFGTNFLGMIRTTQAALPTLRKQGYGRIINFSSINGVLGIPFQSAYTASKHAVEGFSETLGQEVSRRGIHVSVVEPGDCRGGSQKYRNENEDTARASSPYYTDYQGAVSKIRQDEAQGMDPIQVAKAVERLLRKRNPPARKVVATLTQRSAIWLHKFLPRKTFNKIIAGYYAPKSH